MQAHVAAGQVFGAEVRRQRPPLATQTAYYTRIGTGNWQATPGAPGSDVIGREMVNPALETVEGRIQNLLSANNSVIRQAGDRARQAFADRGLLNSSMAEQAAYEAMVSKAIDIAGPDAERYFSNRRQNVDWQNKFAMNEQENMFDINRLGMQHGFAKELLGEQNKFATDQGNLQQTRNMQSSYQQAISNIDNLYKQQMLAVQSAQMEPQDKEYAIQNMTVNTQAKDGHAMLRDVQVAAQRRSAVVQAERVVNP
jgi:hypothetical protein